VSDVTPSYLLDTDWVIEYLAGREPVASRVLDLTLTRTAVSAATVAELYEGAFGGREPDLALAALATFLDRISVVPFSIDVAREVGRERGRLRREGRSIGDFDLVIGCTARHLGIPVCTNNRRHFERIAGLEVISAP
jgi:predicted nucleic acid-binding protein